METVMKPAMFMLYKLCLCAHKLCLCNINIVYVIFVQTAFHSHTQLKFLSRARCCEGSSLG